MDVDTGIRSRRAENYIPTLPQLNFASMNTRHAEIRVWSAYKEELTSWLCLLDDRFAEELDESEQSAVPVQQSTLDVGKAARSSKLWFLLRQSLSKFQRAQDLIHLIEVAQKGASAGYEFWRLLNRELSVRSRVEGQALREQMINLHPPKHLKRPLDVMRWYMTELMKFESQVGKKYPELKVHEQEAVLGVLKYLDEDAKRYLLLHQTTSGLDAMLKGLQFYDEQLRVLTFQKEHHHGYLNAFGAGKGDKGDKGKGEKGKKGKGDKGKGKGDKGKGKGERADKANKGNEKDKSGKGSSARAKSKAKKTDVCHHCGKKGHWARDCWLRQAAAVSPYEANATVTTGTAGSSGGTTAGNASAATKAAPKPPGSQPTTKGDVGKGAEKGVRTFLEGAYFAMPMVAPSFIESGDKIFWLLDSGSSYHVVSRATLESGHVKVLSRKKRPKTVCQTATGDLVEVGSDTHATIEGNFLTTRPIEKQEGVLSTFACTCRLEAVVSDEIKHNLINLNLLCWKGWRPTLYEGLLTAEQRGITLYPHLYGDCTWLESVVPEHPSAMLASVSSRVGRSVGWSDDFSAHEKQHEFLRHEHESSHEQHDFSQHGHDFSGEQHEQTHVEQSQLPHVCGNTLGESAVGQSSCGSSGVQLVGQSSCGSSEVQLVGRLPARVVELLQSSAVGKPCQDHRLCQDRVGTPSSSGPTTSSGLGPTLGAQGSLRRFVSESELLQQSACVHGLVGRSVGRSVGRAEGQLQSPVGRAEGQLQSPVGRAEGQLRSPVGRAEGQLQSPVGRAEGQLQSPVGRAEGQLRSPVGRAEGQLQSPVGRAEGQLQSPVGRAEGQLQSPVGCAEESLQLNVAAQSPLKARVGRSGKGAQSRATLGDGGYEGTCEMGATFAACAGDLGARRESRDGDRGLGDGKGPSGHDGGSGDGGGGRLGGRARGHHSRDGRNLDPSVPCSGVKLECSGSVGPRPDTSLHLLSALREMVFSGTLDVCGAFYSDPKVDTVGEAGPENSTSVRGGRAGGDVDPVEAPDLVAEDDPRSQAGHPSDGLLPGTGGNLPRRDSARDGRESQEGLGGGAGASAPTGGAAGGIGRRSMGELARLSGPAASFTPPRRPVTPPKQPPRQKAKVEPSPVLQPPMPVPAELPPLPAPVEAPPLGVPLPIQPPLPPPTTAAPAYSWKPTPAPRVGAVYSTPSGQSYRVREELGLLSEAEKEAWRIALNQARQVRPRVASRSLPMPPPAPQRYTVPPPPAPTGSTELPPSAPSSSTTTPWSHVPGFGHLLPPPQVPKEPPRDP